MALESVAALNNSGVICSGYLFLCPGLPKPLVPGKA
jgi:hypothetical protein